MAVNYIYDTANEELVKSLKSKFSKCTRGENFTIYVTDELCKLSEKQDDTTFKIVITRNCSKEFIGKVLEITDFVIYNEDTKLVIDKLKSLIAKVAR